MLMNNGFFCGALLAKVSASWARPDGDAKAIMNPANRPEINNVGRCMTVAPLLELQSHKPAFDWKLEDGHVTAVGASASISVATSMIAGRLDASAWASAGANSLARSTRIPSAPISSASLAKFIGL